jgi:hypothetical protein
MAKTPLGNVLADVRAENDTRMLASAFVETADFKTLNATPDHILVVGRRGTGKSALCLRMRNTWQSQKDAIVISVTPTEVDLDGLRKCICLLGETYHEIRGAARIAWKCAILNEIRGRATVS